MIKENLNRKQGEELNQLSRLIFDKVAVLWLVSLILEIFGGILAVSINFFDLSNNYKLVFAIIVFVLLFIAYTLRIKFTNQYEDAETMRRQSVLTEALDWPISQTQFSDWRLKAGNKILNNFKVTTRDENYYNSRESMGPRRLLEMTIESAFFTRHIYIKIKNFLTILCFVILIIFVFILSIAPIDVFSAVTRLNIVYLLYILLPLFIALDLFGWVIKLNRLAGSLKEIEEDLERLEAEADLKSEQVMRLVSEYNCQVVMGLPILNAIFKHYHGEIKNRWDQRDISNWSK